MRRLQASRDHYKRSRPPIPPPPRNPSGNSCSSLSSLASQILFDVSTSLTKLSMLAMLYRLTKASGNKRMTTVVLSLAGVISLNAFLFIIVTVFQCRYG